MRFDVRAVVFDMDGVLLDTEAINVQSAFDAFAALGHPLEAEDASLIVGRHPDDYVPELMDRRSAPASSIGTLRDDQTQRYTRLWRDQARLLPGAREALRIVRERGLAVGLATASGRANVDRALDRFGLRESFDLTLTKDDVAVRKPNPEVYVTAAARLHVLPAAMLVVEDSGPGVRAAKSAGARCVAVRSPHTAAPLLAAADALIESLEELPGLL